MGLLVGFQGIFHIEDVCDDHLSVLLPILAVSSVARRPEELHVLLLARYEKNQRKNRSSKTTVVQNLHSRLAMQPMQPRHVQATVLSSSDALNMLVYATASWLT